MKSYPASEDVLSGLGGKVASGLARAVAKTRKDLAAYRETHSSWVSDSSERGLANWIHDRLWAHVCAEFDGHPDIGLSDREPTREITVGVNYRLRVKRHRVDGKVSSYATQTALEFYAQGEQEAFPGLEEVRLIAGYEWDADTRSMGDAVLSLRDGEEVVIWQITLPEADTGIAGVPAQPIRPTEPEPALPTIDLPEAGSSDIKGEVGT
ncbi:hypothetical protein KBP30_20955 [Streptomyces sp. Go40/10]|uniref:hypothetical protein n=1 Tax=Streptomyces sp. Go40/10 TaxID=2825844 RepID=UPI001E413926|nr:hypothetical protein [Streptomyces sp. Go40/10]UFR03482.1 hypothetical protein KBP30_20955 [Streptomyces sp. Go40/10]